MDHSIDVDILRMDLSYGPQGDADLVRNPYGIVIEFNNSPVIVKGLMEVGICPKDFLVCHNFYPQRYTAMKWNKFVEKNKELKACSRDLRIGAFISSTAENTHGVWDATEGLPTVERLRKLPIDLQARMLLATGDVDDILIGNAFAKIHMVFGMRLKVFQLLKDCANCQSIYKQECYLRQGMWMIS